MPPFFHIERGLKLVMGVIELLLGNQEQITFSLLFIGLLVWVIRNNAEREDRYHKMIDDLTVALRGYDEIKKTVDEINQKLK